MDLHCGAEAYLRIFSFKEDVNIKVKETILKYTAPNASYLSRKKINYFAFRFFDALKSLVGKAEWQKTINICFPENHSLIQLYLIKHLWFNILLAFHTEKFESIPETTFFKFKQVSDIFEGKKLEELVFTREELRNLQSFKGKCNHGGTHSYWD